MMKNLHKNDALLGMIAVALFIAGSVLSQWYIATMFILSLCLALISGALTVSRPGKGKEEKDGRDDDSDSGD